MLFRTVATITALVWLSALWRCIAAFSQQEVVFSTLATAQTCFVSGAAAFSFFRRKRGLTVALILVSLLPAYFAAHKLWGQLVLATQIPHVSQYLFQPWALFWLTWMVLFAATPLCWAALLLGSWHIKPKT